MIVALLQDLFETIPTTYVGGLFGILEEHFQNATGQIRWMDYLKISNQILKKLSMTVQTGLWGRIQLLLSKLFKQSHPSGANKRRLPNMDNVTICESKEEIEQSRWESTVVDEFDDQKYEEYVKFWKIQSYLAKPVIITHL